MYLQNKKYVAKQYWTKLLRNMLKNSNFQFFAKGKLGRPSNIFFLKYLKKILKKVSSLLSISLILLIIRYRFKKRNCYFVHMINLAICHVIRVFTGQTSNLWDLISWKRHFEKHYWRKLAEEEIRLSVGFNFHLFFAKRPHVGITGSASKMLFL